MDGKGIELRVDGYFNMNIFDLDGTPVSEKVESEILSKLQTSEYLIGLESKKISSLDDYLTPLYSFELDGTDAMNYEFSEKY